MPDTLIGHGKSLDEIKLGLDAIVFNEAKHCFREANGRMYSMCSVVKVSGGYDVYLTGESKDEGERKSYER